MPGTTARKSDPAKEEAFVAALYKGGELLAAGKVVDAREHLEKAHELDPKNEKAQNLLGLTYFKLGLFEQASHIYELLVNENPADPTLRVNLGLVYLKSNHLERAVKEFETATDLDPNHKKAHNYLGLALAQAGDYARARDHFSLAGSDQMAEKMDKALTNRTASQPSNPGLAAPSPEPHAFSSAPSQATSHEPPPPATAYPGQVLAVAVSSPLPPPRESTPTPPPLPEVVHDDAIEVMSDDEVLVDSPSQLGSDWGDHVAPPVPPPPPSEDELRFAEDEGPVSTMNDAPLMAIDVPVETVQVATEPLPPEMPMLDATEVSVDAAPVPAWLAMEANHASADTDPAPAPAPESPMWVTDAVAEVPMEASEPPPPPPDAWEPPAPTADSDDSWVGVAGAVAPIDAPIADFDAGEAPPDPDWASSVAQLDAAPPAVSIWAETTYSEQSWAEQPATHEVDQADTSVSYTEPPVPEEQLFTQPVVDLPTDEVAYAEQSYTDGGPYVPSETEPYGEVPHSSGELQDPYVPSHHDVAAGLIDDPPNPVPPALPPAAPSRPDGYAPMASQRLMDLGASTGWVDEPTAGPFQIGAAGLAVTVSGEMLVRMTGLVAVVGSVKVAPEARRKRGRPTQEPFGEGAAQLQRLSGHGVVYLETGSVRFHAVDLADQPGVAVDDEGAYLREELVFGFEEAVSYENGRLAAEPLSLDLVHLKGHGRVLLALEGALKAMAVPPGAPMVVPLHRLVGWFGRVTPRLVGFGGQGAVELTGDGFALLGTPG